ncbi:MAG: GNAT family N-acetyltransferase [Verrucomicrobiales bacterium]|nr:GNAT family N-acetyltransferase [Verrucomicrobiales bacterium]MCP5526269.1 GNAT family N-acetyltransferase [Verrucomicrobiales bacterium]
MQPADHSPPPILTRRLELQPWTREELLADLANMPPAARAEVSPEWLRAVETSPAHDPWIHGFKVIHRESGGVVGRCGFKGPPDAEGVVEIAYGIEPEQQSRGFATEATAALASHAFSQPLVRLVRAHTLPQPNASTRVLEKCGFTRIGEVQDPEDGSVWRWERRRPSAGTPPDHGRG